MWEVGHLGGNVSGSFFGKGCPLQKETSGGVEGHLWLPYTWWQHCAALLWSVLSCGLCFSESRKLLIGLWCNSVTQEVKDWSSNSWSEQDRRGLADQPLVLYDTMCDRQLSFLLDSFQRSLLCEIKSIGGGDFPKVGRHHGKYASSGSEHVNVGQCRLTSRSGSAS